MPKFSIVQKIIITITSFIIILGTLASLIVYFKVKNTLIDQETNKIQLAAQLQAEKVNKIFRDSAILVKTACHNSIVIDFLKSDDKPEQDSQVLSLLSSYNLGGLFSAIYLMDNTGLTLISTDPSFVGNNYSFRDYFTQANLENVFIDMSVGITSKEPGFYFSCPVFDDNDSSKKILGVIVFKLTSQAFDADFQDNDTLQFNNNQPINLHLIDENGIIIQSNQSEKIYKSLGSLSSDIQQSIINQRTFENITIEPLSYQSIQDDLVNKQTLTDYYLLNNTDNQTEILSLQKLENAPFYLLLETGTAIFRKSANQISIIVSLFVAIAATIAIFLIIFFLQKILNPIKIINQVSQEIVQGSLDKKINIKSGDEFEELANNFNSVTSKLIKSNQNIQKKVDEKTQNLQKINKYMVGRELKMIELKKKLSQLQHETKKKN